MFQWNPGPIALNRAPGSKIWLRFCAPKPIVPVIEKAGYKPGEDIMIALDPASSEFWDAEKGLYVFKKSDGSEKTAEELVDIYAGLVEKFPIISIEDSHAENDWDGWKIMTEKLGDKIQLVGDDLFVTNVEFLQKGIDLTLEADALGPHQLQTPVYDPLLQLEIGNTVA